MLLGSRNTNRPESDTSHFFQQNDYHHHAIIKMASNRSDFKKQDFWENWMVFGQPKNKIHMQSKFHSGVGVHPNSTPLN